MTNIWNGANRRIYMQEVGTRDGLQAEDVFVPTEDKSVLVNELSLAGMTKIEVTAFVSPKAIPALRDAEIVMREITRVPGVVYSALVPNERGAERAIDSQLQLVYIGLISIATEGVVVRCCPLRTIFPAFTLQGSQVRNLHCPPIYWLKIKDLREIAGPFLLSASNLCNFPV